MTRVNIQLPEELHRKLKIACAIREKTIKQMIEDALDKELKSKAK